MWNNAAAQGYLEVLKWCMADGFDCDAYTCALIAEEGHLEMVKWCWANDCPWD